MTSASSSSSSHSDTSFTKNNMDPSVTKGAIMIPPRKQRPNSDSRLYQYCDYLQNYTAPVAQKPVNSSVIVGKLEETRKSIRGFVISKPSSPPPTEPEIQIYREPTPLSE